jgi:hypothetical protein
MWRNPLALCLFVAVLTACGGDDGPVTPTPTPADEARTKLTSGAWNLQSVTVDGTNRTSVYAGMTLSFTATNFSTTNGLPVWPASGSWSFANSEGTAITRGDGMAIQVTGLTTSSLQLQLVWDKTTYGPGRSESVDGTHVYTFGH